MKRSLLVFLVAFLANSCAQVYFTAPQPQKGLTIKSFIKDVQGSYVDSILSISILKNEIVIDGQNYLLVSGTPNINEVVVKYYNDFYFASFKDSLYYSVFMGKFYENKLAVYMLNADSRSIESLNKFVTVKTLSADSGLYLIDASKKEFDCLVENELFDVIGVLNKLNN